MNNSNEVVKTNTTGIDETILEDTQEQVTSVIVSGEKNNGILTTLTPDSIFTYDEKTQKAIKKLADEIDVREEDKIISFADGPTQDAIEGKMQFLNEMVGEPEDEETVKLIAELSSRVKEEVGELHIAVKEKNFIQRLFEKIFKDSSNNDKTVDKIQNCAQLLTALNDAMNKQIEKVNKLKNLAKGEIEKDVVTLSRLSQYVIAGLIADKRIEEEIEAAEQNTSMMNVEEMNDLKLTRIGLDTFKTVLKDRETARGVTGVSLMSCYSSYEHLKKLEVAYRSSQKSVLHIFSQNATNALLARGVRNAVENYKSVKNLNESLMQENAKLTAENFVDVADLITAGIMDPSVMEECVKIMLDGFEKGNAILHEHENDLEVVKEGVGKVLDGVAEFVVGNSNEIELKELTETEKLARSVSKSHSGNNSSNSKLQW